MLLSQIITPFAYAVSGEEIVFEENVLEVVEPVFIPEIDNSTGDNKFEVGETNT